MTLRCTECHTVVGVDLPRPIVASSAVVELGGSVARLRTVGDLLISIIHPGEAISSQVKRRPDSPDPSPMPARTDEMAVAALGPAPFRRARPSLGVTKRIARIFAVFR